MLQVNAVAHLNSDLSNAIGLGLRQALLSPLKQSLTTQNAPCTILEIAPENWCGMGGIKKQYLDEFAAHFTWYSHGLSLSLGGTAPLDFTFLDSLKIFLEQYKIACYSEHLSFSGDEQGLLYDLLPLPFNSDTVMHVAHRIQTVQDYLQRRIAIENISYYTQLDNELTEAEFITAVLNEADCDLLLDVNNVYVNCVNHNDNANQFIKAMPSERIVYLHVAGHQKQLLTDFNLHHDDANANIIIDTHHYPVPDPVWTLLNYTYACHGVKPTVLECDNGIPAWANLCLELQQIRSVMGSIYV
ncbi:MAG: hypothetical protein K0R48_377 [Gammaproteobacteria bacterium]|nr:hypothetical protein [Gammaproteobacteria bacterium]